MARARLARLAAPAAFLLAVTIALLLVRSGLEGGSGSDGDSTLATLTSSTRSTTTTVTTTKKRPRRRFYTIQSGDTLATVAATFGTTVEQLLALNPEIDPRSLRVGQKIRVE
jgi:peptidoglycan DL-endopeptidase LytE